MKRFKYNGLSLAEMLLTLLISTILLAATFPLIAVKISNKTDDTSAITCIKSELAANTSSAACSQAIKNCRYTKNNAYKTISFLANHGSGNATSGQQQAARKILKETCDQGGNAACKHFIEDCQRNNDACNIANLDYDFHYYLNLLTSNPIPGRTKIESLGKAYYSIGYSNIVTAVDTVCPGECGTSTACAIKGINSECPAPPDPACGAEDIGSLRVSKCNNTYNLVANNVNPGGAGCWQGLNTACTGTGCSRPLCNWAGAEQACIALNGGVDYGTKNWRLPTNAEMQSWRVTYESNSDIIAAVKTAMDLCDYANNAMYAPYCNLYSGCTGSSGLCFPFYMWSAEPSGSDHYYFDLITDTWSGPQIKTSNYAFSTRCVRNL